MQPQTILFSHGFGVDRTDRGLFTDIAAAFPHRSSVMFDYNHIDHEHRTLTATPIEQQVRLLKSEYAKLDTRTTTLSLICHSQGCLVAALADLSNIEKVIMITPAQTIDVDAFLRKFEGRENTHIDRNSDSTFGRRDGSTTIVPKAYLDSIEGLDLHAIYHRFCERNDVFIISARDDEVLKQTNFDYLRDTAEVITLPGDHNFSDKLDRQRLLQYIVGKL